MILDFATVIINKAFEMVHKEIETYNEGYVDEFSQLDIDKIKNRFNLNDFEVIGFLDCCDWEQQDDTVFAESILREINDSNNLISIIGFFENSSSYQQYYKFLVKELV